MANKNWGAGTLTGGGTDALDKISGTILTVGDHAFYVDGTYGVLIFDLTNDGGGEASPRIIVPDSSPGSLNWVLQPYGGGLRLPTFAVTISGGVVTGYGSGIYEVDTEGSASTDDLDEITGVVEGDLVVLKAANASRTVVVKDGSSIYCGQDFSLNSVYDRMTLIGHDTDILAELTRSNNG